MKTTKKVKTQTIHNSMGLVKKLNGFKVGEKADLFGEIITIKGITKAGEFGYGDHGSWGYISELKKVKN